MLFQLEGNTVAVCSNCGGTFKPGPSRFLKFVAWLILLTVVFGAVLGITSYLVGSLSAVTWVASSTAVAFVIIVTALDLSVARRRLDRAIAEEEQRTESRDGPK
jgi:membrane protein implicated in regulation of membrane protease activity